MSGPCSTAESRDPWESWSHTQNDPREVEGGTLECSTPRGGVLEEEEEARAATRYQPVAYKSEDEPAEDPMVSEPIRPLVIPIVLTGLPTGHHGEYRALLDSVCTRCLITKAVVTEVGIRVKQMASPVWFEQVDGSLLGRGAPDTLITEPVQLEMGAHWRSSGL